MQGGDSDQLTVIVSAEQHARLVTQPVGQAFTHSRAIGRITKLTKQNSNPRRVLSPNRAHTNHHTTNPAPPPTLLPR